ncbi:MAG: hypothetical protein CBE38_03140 [Gammaproteobacteria bacterium TMED278]|nr:MAG: hypothetical protein CBE38_03140 [Gammaproteobacteria bacterium TMED278]|tara:strand:+ start:949 stop:1479 length:531 start_codon:yes stop_codon:yes gene_type:complete
MKKIKLKRNKGILFWITGLSGSGKTRIAKRIVGEINKSYGKTIVLSGDEIRNIFKLKGYSYKNRLDTVFKYCKLAKKITSQNVNVIFAVIGMIEKLRNWNRRKQSNYVEIFIKSDLKKIIKAKKKRLYHKKISKIVGIDIKPEFPKKPHIKIINNFDKDINYLSEEVIKKIKNLLY